MVRPFDWLFSHGPRERQTKDAADKLQMSMRMTAKCRYNAAVRLQHLGNYAFFTTTLLSLGLIFIPLIQNASVPLAYKANVLNMMQIFLGVAVLVYSVVIGTARHDMRSSQLTECGDKLKELIRALEKDREAAGGNIAPTLLAEYQKHYSDIVTDVENHARNDYRFAVLEMQNDYFLRGIPRFKLWLQAHLTRLSGFLLPSLLIAAEIIFITDMIGATNILTPYLNGSVVEAAQARSKNEK